MARVSVEAEVGGVVSRIERRAGERVARDEPIMFVELMKMEIPIVAPIDGTVVEVRVDVGEVVVEGQKVASVDSD